MNQNYKKQKSFFGNRRCLIPGKNGDSRSIQTPLAPVNWASQDKYKMSLKEWVHFDYMLSDVIVNSTPITGNDTFSYLPIGVQKRYFRFFYNEPATLMARCKKAADTSLLNTQLLNYSIGCKTDGRRKHNIVNRYNVNEMIRKEKPWIKRTPGGYFGTLWGYRFIISPEGNGIDCHRHYEAWLTKTIPIIEARDATKNKFSTLPVLWTYNYSELSPEYLEEKYNEMYDSSRLYDFSMLFYSSYSKDIQQIIRECSTYWITKDGDHIDIIDRLYKY